MSSTTSRESILRCVASRDEAFRYHFSNETQNVAPDVTVQVEAPCPADEQFYRFTLAGVNRVPSQLHPELARMFLCDYPLGEISPTTAAAGGDQSKQEPKQHLQRPEKCDLNYYDRERYQRDSTGEYKAEEDAAFLLDEIDSGVYKSCRSSLFDISGEDADGGADAVNDPEPEVEQQKKPAAAYDASHETTIAGGADADAAGTCKVPSLLSLAQQAARKVVLAEMETLESDFVSELSDARRVAEASVERITQQKQLELELIKASPEQKEVDRLRRLLEEAEGKLEEKTLDIQKSAEIERDSIQATYDQDRADAAAKYVEKRDVFHSDFSLHYGQSACQRCYQFFHPQKRQTLPGCKRCCVQGCTATERFCVDCSSTPCPRCFSPICSAHIAAHESFCARECKDRCGYTRGLNSMGRGIEARCCGAKVYNERCSLCGCSVCDDCCTVDEVDRRYMARIRTCFKCRPKGSKPAKDDAKKKRPMRWSSPEYEAERKRRKVDTCCYNGHERMPLALLPPVRLCVNPVKWPGPIRGKVSYERVPFSFSPS